MKNEFEIRGDVTVVRIKQRNGTVHETLIDTDDLSMLQAFGRNWCVAWSCERDRLYVRSYSEEYGQVYLHRLITSPPKGMDVDHINFDRLDNRRANLRVVTRSQNLLHRQGANRNSRTGIRGVTFQNGKYTAYCKVHGRLAWGTFDRPEEAAAAVAAALGL